MNHGPLIFLGSFLLMSLSWLGMIVMPQLQIGRQEQAIIQPTNERYPAVSPPGLAAQGRAVYVANGCQYCHTRSVQAGVTFNVVLSDAGTNFNKAALIAAVQKAMPESTTNASLAASIVETAPQYLARHLNKAEADLFAEKVRVDGAKVDVALEYTGLDIQRGWGNRYSVAQDFLEDQPALVGQLRLGPDLSNVGMRYRVLPWHLIHLYDPDSGSPSSKMPALRFLFETRRIGEKPSTNALRLPVSQIGEGNEVIPKPEAIQLAHYLMSLTGYPGLAEAPAATAPPRPRQLTAALSTNQTAAIALMEQQLTNQTAAVTAARSALLNASFTAPKNDADILTKTETLRSAELALALARADHTARIQTSADRLNSVQLSALNTQSLRGGGGAPARGGGGGRGGGGAGGGGGAPRGGAPADAGTPAPPANRGGG